MAAAPQVGMEKAEMKALLNKSKKEPVNCAIGQAPDGSAVILMKKTGNAKALELEIKKLIATPKNLASGNAEVDLDDDPKLVKLRLSKPVAGMARRLVKTLKGTGFSKVVILSDETVIDSAGEEDEEGATDAAAPAAAAPAAAAPPPPPPPPMPAAKPSADALKKALAEQIARIAASSADDAARAEIIKLATAANVSLRANDLEATASGIGQLRAALDALPPPGTPSAGAAEAASVSSGVVQYTKSRLAWIAARSKVQSELGKLEAELAKTYKDEGMEAQVVQAYKARVAPVLAGFDETLIDKLDEVINSAEPGKRSELVGEAKKIMEGYQAFLASEPLIKDLDDNPFVPLAIQQTVGGTLKALTATIR